MSHQFPMPISEDIWNLKYRLKDPISGQPIDLTVEDTWSRTANALAAVEKDQQTWQGSFYSALEDWAYMPAGRIVAGAGTDRNVTLFNCYVMGTVPDDLAGIFDALKEAALTMQQGGGIGYDFSTLRPKGALVKRVGAQASGPLPFMDTWDAMCRTIMSAGTRRGAMMATLRCDHPDVIDFITAKQDPARLRMFNVSVLCTDDFMEAVKKDKPWDLVFDGKVYETVSALELWRLIMRSTYDYAEPGVIFIDRINQENNLRYCETIAATNPCGEQPLPPYGACLLGSVNLAKMVLNPFTPESRIDDQKLYDVIATAIRMMDNVNDVSNFPLESQHVEAQKKRRIGLGVTGLADMLAMLRIRYGSEQSYSMVNAIMGDIANEAYKTSIELAAEKGAFPLFDYEAFVEDGTFASRMAQDPEIDEGLQTHGIRNALLLSIAPTGTISMYGGNVSSGIEPMFAFEYQRKVTRPDGTKTTEDVKDYAVHLYHEMFPGEPLPDYFVTAQDLPPSAHVEMQSVCQRWIDSSISKTINLPEDIAFADFEQVYMDAYAGGCKGCTTYRPNDVTGSVLSVKKVEKPSAEQVLKEWRDSNPEIVTAWENSQITDRPDALPGATYKVKMGDDPAFYVTITDILENGVQRPFEVFINTKNPEHIAWSTALTRMVSAIFRRPHDSSFVVEELKNVFDPKGGGWWKGKYRPSVVAAIGQVIEDHMKSIGYLVPDQLEETQQAVLAVKAKKAGPLCPKCHGENYKHEGGCTSCGDCGHSSCG